MDKKGIDVSKWQGNIDLQRAKEDGTDFAIIREGYGTTGLDPCFHQNIQNAQKAGIPCGVYHYSYAKSTIEAKKEAEFCLKNIKNYKLEYPVCFDIEDTTQKSLDKQLLTDICYVFCGEIEKNDYYTMIYCNLDWYKNYLFGEKLSEKFDIWLANWDVVAPSVSCGIWQKSSKGVIDGIKGDVDLNVAFKDYPQIMKEFGLNGFSKDSNYEKNLNYTTYTVKKGDSLWEIAENFFSDGSKYPKIKEFNFLVSDTIYPGQVLRIPE
jgi:GH25 family lysozyme M1 (1,4-beta-N-acetylmuramidase)